MAEFKLGRIRFIWKDVWTPTTAYLKDEPREDDYTMDTTYPDLKPIFDMNKPMFFSSKNPILYHILAMCEKPDDLTRIFNESYTFLARTRCYWLK
jgi:hypothetical protein